MASHAFSPHLAVRRRISLAEIDAAVTGRLGATRGIGKSQPACFNRQVAMYLAKHVAGWSTTVIGRFYNGRDHSTVCHAIRQIRNLRDVSKELDEVLSTLESILQDPHPFLGDGPSGKQPSVIRLDKLREDVLLDKLADRLASRLVRLLRSCEVNGDSTWRGQADNRMR